MKSNTKLRWIWRVPAETAHVNWGMAFGTPEVFIEFTVPDTNEKHGGRQIQVRFDPDDARRLAALMWRLGDVANHYPVRKVA